MTPTPRVDKATVQAGECYKAAEVIHADFARELERENAELRKALEPFAKFGKKLIGRRQVPTSGVWQGLDSGCDGEVSIDIEHFQAARSALVADSSVLLQDYSRNLIAVTNHIGETHKNGSPNNSCVSTVEGMDEVLDVMLQAYVEARERRGK